MATARLNGVALHYDAIGSGECVVLTHGSWTDATGWGDAATRLAERYRVVTWDRRGHSRSEGGDGAGSRAEDAADLAALIEHVSDAPVHVVGSSYGASVTLTLLATRPDLVVSAMVHEPPLFGLLDGTPDPALREQLALVGARLQVVRDLLEAGRHRDAAACFVEQVALGAGAWQELPDAMRATLERNAGTFLDELNDDTALTIDPAALRSITAPVLLTYGTASPPLFAAVIAELRELCPSRTEVLDGAGHLPHVTHTDEWVARLVDFHERTVRRDEARAGSRVAVSGAHERHRRPRERRRVPDPRRR
jgi:pimeloyl-ACP methyl ester carboxylesterase